MADHFEGYYTCVSRVQQSLVGPDGTGRMVSRGNLVHSSQSSLLGKSKSYVKFRAIPVAEFKEKYPKTPVIGGPHNNMKGVYVPRVVEEAVPSEPAWSEEDQDELAEE